MKEKLIRITETVFAYGMLVLMLAALVVGIGYVVAFFIGPVAAEALTGFFAKWLLHPTYIIAMGLCVIGVINMYLRKEHVFLLDLPKKERKK